MVQRELPYGQNARICVDLANEALIADCSSAGIGVLADPAQAVRAALLRPLEFPSLAEAVFPGDRVTVALDAATPRPSEVVGAVLAVLLDAGVLPRDLTVLRPASAGSSEDGLQAAVAAQLGTDAGAAIRWIVHDPSDARQLMYLAATDEGRPIYLNRALGDADFVIPVTHVRADEAWGYLGPQGTLFPSFSDVKTLDRLRAPARVGERLRKQARQRAEAAEVAWLLGIRFSVLLVPGPGDELLHILAGDVDAVRGLGQELWEAAWSFAAPDRAQIVLATIEGGPHQQTWENVARAVESARGLLQTEGAVVLCTRLADPPSQVLRRLIRAEPSEWSRGTLTSIDPAIRYCAAVLREALETAHVYLLSALGDDELHELGLVPVATADDVRHMVAQASSCILLANAHQAAVAVLAAS